MKPYIFLNTPNYWPIILSRTGNQGTPYFPPTLDFWMSASTQDFSQEPVSSSLEQEPVLQETIPTTEESGPPISCSGPSPSEECGPPVTAFEAQAREEQREAAARSIQPGCKQWMLSGWTPKNTKPQLKHLVAEYTRRCGNQPPKSWAPQQVADWLLKKEPPSGREQVEVVLVHDDETKSSDTTSAPPFHLPPSSVKSAEPRWWACRQGARLLHVIHAMPQEFLQRDVGHQSRLEKEGAARNSFWVKAATLFNDKAFQPQSIVNKINDMQAQVELEKAKIDPSWTPYEGVLASKLVHCMYLMPATVLSI